MDSKSTIVRLAELLADEMDKVETLRRMLANAERVADDFRQEIAEMKNGNPPISDFEAPHV